MADSDKAYRGGIRACIYLLESCCCGIPVKDALRKYLTEKMIPSVLKDFYHSLSTSQVPTTINTNYIRQIALAIHVAMCIAL